MVYDQLSKDPNSLSNLDQDLPNYAQHSVPIFSLPMVVILLLCENTLSLFWQCFVSNLEQLVPMLSAAAVVLP